jgi:hypothetical protein
MDQQKSDNPNLEEEMERDSQIRRDTQVRGSLGVPPSGSSGEPRDREEAVPEFERGSDEDRESER